MVKCFRCLLNHRLKLFPRQHSTCRLLQSHVLAFSACDEAGLFVETERAGWLPRRTQDQIVDLPRERFSRCHNGLFPAKMLFAAFSLRSWTPCARSFLDQRMRPVAAPPGMLSAVSSDFAWSVISQLAQSKSARSEPKRSRSGCARLLA